MTTTAMKITADWPRKRELPLVHELYSRTRPMNSAGEIDMTNTMIFRTDDGGPRKIHAACTYAISTVGTEMTVQVSRWAVCPDMSPNEQKQLATAMFASMESKINTGDAVVTVVSEYDLWRQILLRFCGFQFVCAVDISGFCGPTGDLGDLYRFSRSKE